MHGQCVVREEENPETMRAKLLYRSICELTRQNNAEERTVMAIGFNERHDRALNLSGLVS